MKTVVVNGVEEHEPLVRVTMFSLSSLIRENPIAFYELVRIARNKLHQPFGHTGDRLRELSLIDDRDLMHDSVRNIILANVEGEGLEMTLKVS